MLIVFGGLPGTGKTTLSRKVASRLGGVYIRIDAVEQAIRSGLAIADIGAAGYAVALALAEANLALGSSVIADCVNPVSASRIGWRSLAERMNARLIEVEVICSNAREHQRRVEGRTADIPGHTLPSWASVLAHVYEPWEEPHIVVDTAVMNESAAVEFICAAITDRHARPY